MDNNIILELKPKFVWWVRLCAKNCISLCIIFCFLLPMTIVFDKYSILFLVISFFALILSLLFVLFLEFKNFQTSSYQIYHDRVDFKEGFINYKHSSIKFADVRELHYRQNFIQRLAGLATISFVTAANSDYNSTGICIIDIENALDIYNQIKILSENVK